MYNRYQVAEFVLAQVQFRVEEGNLQKREKNCIDNAHHAAHSKVLFTIIAFNCLILLE